MKSKMEAFYIALQQYGEGEIEIAFNIWIAENIRMPVPADIAGLIRASRPSVPIGGYVSADEVEKKSYFTLSDEQKKEIDALLSQAKEALKPEDKRKTIDGKKYEINTKHYDRMSAEQKEAYQSEFIKAHRNLIE